MGGVMDDILYICGRTRTVASGSSICTFTQAIVVSTSPLLPLAGLGATLLPVSRNYLYSSAHCGSFSFNCLSHPPNIRPISSKSWETVRYLLLSKALTFQATWQKNYV